MRTQEIYFPDRQQTLCVFPDERSNLAEAMSELGLEDNHPVIVLIGGDIDKREALPTRQAIITISKIAENLNAVVVCVRPRCEQCAFCDPEAKIIGHNRSHRRPPSSGRPGVCVACG